jgi:hypothetical protein
VTMTGRPGRQFLAFPPRGSIRRRESLAPSPAPPPHTRREVLPHRAFPRAVDYSHSALPQRWRVALAIRALHEPCPSREQVLTLSGTPAAVHALVAHPASGPSLQRVMLSAPSSLQIWPPLTSARRSLTSRLLAAYRVRRYRTPRAANPRPRLPVPRRTSPVPWRTV